MTRSRLSLLAAGCGIGAAAILPGSSLGLGVVVIAACIGGTVIWARPAPVTIHSLIWAALAACLVAMALIRSATWVVAVDLVAAMCFGSLAVAGGRTWSEIVGGAGSAGASLGRGFGLVLAPLREKTESSLKGRAAPVLRGLAIAGALMLVFGGLFLSADRAFAQLASRLLSPEIETSLLPARIYLILFVVALTGALIVIGPRYQPSPSGGEDPVNDPGARRKLSMSEWSISLGLLNALFAGFVAVQITVLFGGRHHVLDTVGLTYAQYARQGFFQLVAIAVLVLIVIAGAVRWARADSPRARLLLKVLLGGLCIFSLVVLASALKRLSLYEDVFGLTRLRISVHAVILWLGLLFGMLIVAGVMWRGDWLPRSITFATGLCMVVFSLVNPEGLIARQNVERLEETGLVDVGYLQGLSADAVPALAALPADVRRCVYEAIYRRLPAEESWRSFNVARHRAADVLDDPPPAAGVCP